MNLPIDDEVVMVVRKDIQSLIHGMVFAPVFFILSVALSMQFFATNNIWLFVMVLVSTFSMYLSIVDILSYFCSEVVFCEKFLINISANKKVEKIYYEDIKSYTSTNILDRGRMLYKINLKDNSTLKFYHNQSTFKEVIKVMKNHGVRKSLVK